MSLASRGTVAAIQRFVAVGLDYADFALRDELLLESLEVEPLTVGVGRLDPARDDIFAFGV